MNDSIVVWRAWAVAGHRVLRLILSVSLAFTISTLFLLVFLFDCTLTVFEVSVIVDLGAFYSVFTQKSIGQQSENGVEPSILLVYIPLLFTNIVSTVIIFWKTWFVLYLIGEYLY